MKVISTPNAPAPAGHYSQGIVYGGVVYVAGMLGIDPGDPDGDPGDAAQQTRTALENVRAVLEAAGSGLDRVLHMTVYVSDPELWGTVNETFAEVMGEHRPTRAIVPVKTFKGRYVLEIVTTAALA